MKGQESTVIYPSADMWMGNTYATNAQNDNYVRIGGWGDRYFGFWKFDWNSVKKSKEIDSVMLYFYPDKKQNSYNQLVSSATMYLLSTPWNETTSKISDSLRGWNMGSFNLDRDSGLVLNITSLYEYWRDNPSWNYGFMLYPDQNDNKYYFFPSRESGSPDRTRVVVYYKEEIPDFKLPLPGGKEWVVNTEIGEVLPSGSHDSENHYSIDFGYYSRKAGVVVMEQNVRIYAAAGGVITTCKYDQYNGYNVTIDHDGDGSTSTGFQTRYLHLAFDPGGPGPIGSSLKVGKVVTQGTFIGIIQDTFILVFSTKVPDQLTIQS
jgi:hypothetical protein